MSSKKPLPKKASKPVKKAAKPVKKAAPAKKSAPAKKKPAPKNVVKPAKKVVKPAKKSAKPAPKAAKKPIPVQKPISKSIPKPVAKPAGKPVPAAKTKPVLPPMPLKPVKKPLEPMKEVKVPKTSVKTSVPYRPGYTPLEKRSSIARPNEPIVRYNDNDLAEFRDLINKKLEAAKKELAYLQGLITRKDEMGGDNDDARYMTMEDGSMSMEREQLSQMASRQITYIDHLEKAIRRIENKTYGICRVTGKLIDKARLRAVPHATLSLEAKLGLVRLSTEQ